MAQKKVSFSCGEALDITRAEKLYERLKLALEKSITIEMKADKVIKADTAGLQLLVVLIEEIKDLGGKLVWKSPSEKLVVAAHKLGLAGFLELPVDNEIS